MTNAEFIKYVIDFCVKNKVVIRFSPYYKEDCTGYFDHRIPEIYVYFKRNEEDWFADFLHEFCHAEQWLSNYQLYWESNKYNLLDDTKNRNKYSTADLKHMLSVYRDVEADCERRAILYIKKFKLSIDAIQYAKKANACIYHYNMLLYYGWNVPSPDSYEEIVNAMPSKIKKSYKNTPTWLKKMYTKYYGKLE